MRLLRHQRPRSTAAARRPPLELEAQLLRTVSNSSAALLQGGLAGTLTTSSRKPDGLASCKPLALEESCASRCSAPIQLGFGPRAHIGARPQWPLTTANRTQRRKDARALAAELEGHRGRTLETAKRQRNPKRQRRRRNARKNHDGELLLRPQEEAPARGR